MSYFKRTLNNLLSTPRYVKHRNPSRIRFTNTPLKSFLYNHTHHTGRIAKKSIFGSKRAILLYVFITCNLLYFTNFPISKKFRDYLTYGPRSYLKDVLLSDELYSSGLDLMKRLFAHENCKKAVCILMIDLLSDNEFKQKGEEFGVNLVGAILEDQKVRLEIKRLFIRVISTDEFKNESIKLLGYATDKNETKDLVAQFFKVIFVREDIFKSLERLFADSFTHVVSSENTKQEFSEFLSEVWSDQNLRWRVLRRTFDFQNTSPTMVKVMEPAKEDKVTPNT